MSLPRITESVAEQVLKLHADELDASEIARILDLKKGQVRAIIAHQFIAAAGRGSEGPPADFSEAPENEQRCKPELTEGSENGAFGSAPEAIVEEEGASEGILIGEDNQYGGALYWNPEDTTNVPNPHLMIVGESGFGKTYAVQCLTAELGQRKIPSVVFDYGQGFEPEKLDPVFRKYANPHEYRIGEEGIALNPLQIFPNDAHGPKSVASRVSDIFDAVYSLGAIQRKVLIEAVLRVFEKSGITAGSRDSWTKPAPPFSAVQEMLDEMSSDKQYSNSKNAVGLSARLTTFFMLTSFRSDEHGWSWATLLHDLAHQVHVLQFRGLEGKTQRVLVEILLWHLFFYLKSSGQSTLRLYCILDEAHHLSFRESGPVDMLLREARKFGLGIIFASQQPEDFSPVAFSNSASKLVFQTTDTSLKTSKFLAAKCSNYDSPEHIHETISVLPKGDALFITRNRGHQVHIADLKLRATLWRAD